MMEFDMPKELSSIIKVIGVGGGGGNAVGHMYKQGVKGVDFIICNTDKQHLDKSPISIKIQLGPSLTEGLGAGSFPETGRNAAVESIDEIRSYLEKGTKMVFITAGMGGGTGTGAAPVIAQIAKEMGILTVGIVTSPFRFEGKIKQKNAESGIEELRKHVDSLLVINNEKLFELENKITMNSAFAQADNVLCTAARGIADVISETGIINVDFNDVKTVMKNSGVALMGTAIAEGENRAIECIQAALSSPLLNDNIVYGAKHIILNISYGDIEIGIDEMNEITSYINQEVGDNSDLFLGHVYNPDLGNKMSITFIATGFNKLNELKDNSSESILISNLDDEVKSEVKAPMQNPFDSNKIENTNETVLNQVDEPFLMTVESESEQILNSLQENEYIKEENKNLFEFELKTTVENESITLFKDEETSVTNEERIVVYDLEKNVISNKNISEKNINNSINSEEQQRLNNKRMSVFNDLANQLKKPEFLREMESNPAYKRMGIDLDLSSPSSEKITSNYNISSDGKGNSSIKSNNSFLHGNVD